MALVAAGLVDLAPNAIGAAVGAAQHLPGGADPSTQSPGGRHPLVVPECWDPVVFKERIDKPLRAFWPKKSCISSGSILLSRHAAAVAAASGYWGWRAAEESDNEALARPAASMELVHAAACRHLPSDPDCHGRVTPRIGNFALRVDQTPRPLRAAPSIDAGKLSWQCSPGKPVMMVARRRPLACHHPGR